MGVLWIDVGNNETNKHHDEMQNRLVRLRAALEDEGLVLRQRLSRTRALSVLEAHEAILRSLPRSLLMATMSVAGRHAQILNEVHASHLAVVCGGYVGCLVCGHVTCFQDMPLEKEKHKRYATSRCSAHAFFAQRCRLHCPPGSKTRVRRLVRGKLPKSRASEVVDVIEWPSGEHDPQPVLLSRVPL
jgi:hypothetical protein